MNETDLKARAYDSIIRYFERNEKYISLTEAVSVVGGEKRLASLMADGKVREADNKATKSNCKRLFRASDVYSHVRTYK